MWHPLACVQRTRLLLLQATSCVRCLQVLLGIQCFPFAFHHSDTIRPSAVCHVQTALILDMLRSLQFLREDPAYKGRIGKVAFFGHSMGAAGAIVAASKVKVSPAHT